MAISSLFPSSRPSLSLDFAKSRRLDPRISFTRVQTGNIASYTDSNGLIRYAGPDEPRFDHDPVTGESLGLLVEETRHNKTTYSDYSSVTLQNVVKSTTTSTLAPDGTSIFAFEANNNTSITHRIILSNGNTGSATTPHVASFFVKIPPIGPDQISTSNDIRILVRWRSNGGSGTGAVIYYNQTSKIYTIIGAVGSFGGNPPATYDPVAAGAYVEQWPNDWVRLIFPGAISSSNAFESFGSYDWNISETSVEQGGNCTVFLWGAQFEDGAFMTSYIPTSGTGVTRPTDNISITGTNFSEWYNPSEWSIGIEQRVEESTLFSSPNGKNQLRFRNSANTNGFEIRFVSSLSDPYLDAHGTISPGTIVQFDFNGSSGAAFPEKSKSFLAVKNNDSAFCFNRTVQTDGSVTVFDSNFINLCESPTVSRISKISYYPSRLPNETLQTLTK